MRQILKIGVTYNSVEEALLKLGLPPNGTGDQEGFLAYDTDGRLPKAAPPLTADPRLIP